MRITNRSNVHSDSSSSQPKTILTYSHPTFKLPCGASVCFSTASESSSAQDHLHQTLTGNLKSICHLSKLSSPEPRLSHLYWPSQKPIHQQPRPFLTHHDHPTPSANGTAPSRHSPRHHFHLRPVACRQKQQRSRQPRNAVPTGQHSSPPRNRRFKSYRRVRRCVLTDNNQHK